MDKIIRYPIFQSFDNVLAFTSTRESTSDGKARFTGDRESVFTHNRQELAEMLGIETRNLIFPRQTHTATVCCVDVVPEIELTETDALVSNTPGLCLCVQTADCVPILLFDPVQNVVAAVHAGWRGTVARIVQKTVQKMTREFGSDALDIRAAIGPSIGPEMYEVGPEVVEKVRNSIPNAASTLRLNSLGRFHFDLWEANRLLLLEAGLAGSHIELLAECSFTDAEKYYSARREGADTGRMVSGIMLKA